MAILDIRGTHGSGKSWLVHKLLKSIPSQDYKENGITIGYQSGPIAVVGKYDRVCGGCDGIKTADEVVRRVKLFNRKGINVVLEGILVAHTFKRYAELANELGDYHFLFLDTPEDVCIQRVIDRRRKAGNTKPFNPANLKKDYEQIWVRTKAKCEEAGLNVHVLRYDRAWKDFTKVLKAVTGIKL